ncbi:MAG TPA: DNA polymerase III subunit delta [Desulfomonilia bacterium]
MPEQGKVYLFTGEETFLMEEAIKTMRNSLGEDALMNFYSFAPDDTGAIDKALELLNTIPFFDDRRLVVIRNIHKFDAKSFEKIARYVNNPSDTATLVLTMEGQKPWKEKEKKPWEEKYKALSEKAKKQAFNEMKEGQMISWITARAKSMDKEIEPEAANLLREALLSQSWQIATELEKLCLYAGKRTKITMEDVKTLVLKTYDDTVFKLSDALFDRKAEVLLRIREIEAAGINELEVIASLQNQAIDHFQVLYAPSAKRRNLHSFVEGKIAARRKLWKARELNDLINAFAGVERGIKTGRCLSAFSEITEIAARYIKTN